MERRSIKKFSFWVVVAACLSLSSVLWAKEEFQARLFPEAGPSSQKARKLIISVESYTSTEEVFKLSEVFNKGGYEQFMSAFRRTVKGFVRPTGGRGKKVILHAAQNIHTDKGRKILLVTESQSWSLDTTLRFNIKYPFLVIELDLDSKGKGKGKIYMQADVRLTRHGIIEMVSYDSPPKPLFGVRVLK